MLHVSAGSEQRFDVLEENIGMYTRKGIIGLIQKCMHHVFHCWLILQLLTCWVVTINDKSLDVREEKRVDERMSTNVNYWSHSNEEGII